MHIKMAVTLGLAAAVMAGGCRGAETGESGGGEVARSQVETPQAESRADAPPADIGGPSPTDDPTEPMESTEQRDAGTSPGGTTASGRAAAPAPGDAPATASATAPDAAAVLRRAEAVYEGVRSMEAEFIQNVEVPLLGQSARSQGKLYHRSPDRFLMQFTQPEGDVVVADGRHLWMYYPSVDARQVMRTTMAAAGGQVDLHREFLSNPTERYHAVLGGQETVAGRATDVVVLTPRARSGYRQVRVWIDREDALVRRFEITEENESVRTLELRNIRRNPTLGDQLFQFTPPAGAQVFEQ